jgi:Rrf2 family protein
VALPSTTKSLATIPDVARGRKAPARPTIDPVDRAGSRPRAKTRAIPRGSSSRRRRTSGKNGTMHVSAKVDYAMRALLVIARESESGALIKGDYLAAQQDIPARFLEGILRQLRQSGVVASQRGADGGYRLARAASEITVADVVRALDGPLADVRGDRPENADYEGAAEHLREVWIATRAALRGVLEHVSLADIASGELPEKVTDLTRDPSAWS